VIPLDVCEEGREEAEEKRLARREAWRKACLR